MRKRLFLQVWLGAVVCATSMAGTITYGPIPFTNIVEISYPQFSPALGYLHGVTFDVTNCSLQEDIIADNDATNSVVLDIGLNQCFCISRQPFLPGVEGVIFSAGTNLAGAFASVDDGDGDGSRDGGIDELIVSNCNWHLIGHLQRTNSATLAWHTGRGSNTIFVIRSLWAVIPHVPSDVSVYFTNATYTGYLTVQYSFDDFPLCPRFSAVSNVNGRCSLIIDNCSGGASNTIQRTFDLASNQWTDVHTFVSGTDSTNWTDDVSNGGRSTFYKIRSQ